MALIKVPRPPASAFNKDRPVSSLLRSQLEHLQRAEFRLPANQQTNIYINAIKTEGEAADYMRKVTTAIHKAHAKGVPQKTARVRTVAQLAAVAEQRPARNRKVKAKIKAKTKAGSRRRS
jgi:hypothetical protein